MAAAAGLGAARAMAVDHDPQALEATADNARENGVADRIEVLAPADLAPMQVEVLVANILAGPLVELAPHLTALVAPGGALALSGILTGQTEAVAGSSRSMPPSSRPTAAASTAPSAAGASTRWRG
jgi:ribosomal protein L11 methyltransferase